MKPPKLFSAMLVHEIRMTHPTKPKLDLIFDSGLIIKVDIKNQVAYAEEYMLYINPTDYVLEC